MRQLVATFLVLAGMGLVATRALAADDEAIRFSGIRLGANPEAQPATTVFPEGTRSIYIRLSYEGGTNESISYVVRGRGAIEAFRASRRYQGSGSDTVEVSGSEIYRTLVSTLDESARAGQASAKAGAESGIRGVVLENLNNTHSQVTRMQQAEELLAQVPVTPDRATALKEVAKATRNLAQLSAQAMSLPPDDMAGRQARLSAMAQPFRTAVLAAGQLVQGAGQVRDVAIPGMGVDPPDSRNATKAYTLNIEVAGDPADGREFWVNRSYLNHLPAIRKLQAEPGRP